MLDEYAESNLREAGCDMQIHTMKDLHHTLAFVIGMAGLCMTISPQLHAGDVQIGRYSTLTAMPTTAQIDVLSTTITVQLPERIRTVGEAVRYLLERSGYRLAGSQATGPDTAALLALPLPAAHRHLGPIPLIWALGTLAGPAFRPVQDPVHRLISFELCSSLQPIAHEAGIHLNAEGSTNGD